MNSGAACVRNPKRYVDTESDDGVLVPTKMSADVNTVALNSELHTSKTGNY